MCCVGVVSWLTGLEDTWAEGSGLTALESRPLSEFACAEGIGLIVHPGVGCGLGDVLGEREASPAAGEAKPASEPGVCMRPGRCDGSDAIPSSLRVRLCIV